MVPVGDTDPTMEASRQDIRARGTIVNTLGYDLYADILADTIATLRTPANVGVFAGWGSGKSSLLKKIRDRLREKSDDHPTTKGNILMSLVMLWRLVFYHPPVALERNNKVRFISAYFNALEYTGSDHLWAGLVTKLVGAVEWGIGRIPSGIFRAKPPRKKTINFHTSSNPEKLRFRPIKLCGYFPVWILFLCTLALLLALGGSLLAHGLDKHAYLIAEQQELSRNSTDPNTTLSNAGQKSSFALGAVFLSIPVVGFCFDFFPIALKVIYTQKAEIEKLVTKPDFSKELGVMAKVKEEIRHLNRLINFMERFEMRRIVIAIFIDDLDKLPQQNIAPLLQAIKIMLSDRHSRFVSIIAIDPYSVSDALEMGIQSEFPAINISGHKFLKQMIQVPFSIPEMNKYEKEHLFRLLIKGDRLSFSEVTTTLRETNVDEVDGIKPNDSTALDVDRTENDAIKKLLDSNSFAPNETSISMDDLANLSAIDKPLDEHPHVVSACDCVMKELESSQIFPFIKNNLLEMLRLVGIIKVTTRVIFRRLKQPEEVLPCPGNCEELNGILPLHLAGWVVLVGQWPYRTTWMMQQVEDMFQIGTQYSSNTPLITVYRAVEHNFTLVRGWKKLIQLDEDPDILENFLNTHSNWLNVEFLLKLLPHTISLDRSLKRIVSCTAIARDMKMPPGNMPAKSLALMDVSDVVAMIETVCEGSKRVEEYAKTCIEHNISGSVLLKGDLEEIKQCLDMLLGDWIQFSHLLGRMRIYHKFIL